MAPRSNFGARERRTAGCRPMPMPSARPTPVAAPTVAPAAPGARRADTCRRTGAQGHRGDRPMVGVFMLPRATVGLCTWALASAASPASVEP